MDGARGLLEDLRGDGARTILASSAKQEEVDRYLDLLDARDLVDGWTTAADVDRTKPHPDLVHAALPGGFSEAEMREAGASAVVKSIARLHGNRQLLVTLAR